jgi:hypothetical protein
MANIRNHSIRNIKGKKFECVKVCKTKAELEKWLPRVLIEMFDDQSYRVIKGDNGYGIFVERITVMGGRNTMLLMARPYLVKK